MGREERVCFLAKLLLPLIFCLRLTFSHSGCHSPHPAPVWRAVKGHSEQLYFGVLAAWPPHPSTPSTQSVPWGQRSFYLSCVLSGAPVAPVLSCRCLCVDLLFLLPFFFFSRQLQNIRTAHVPRFTSMLQFSGSKAAYANLEGVSAHDSRGTDRCLRGELKHGGHPWLVCGRNQIFPESLRFSSISFIRL